MAPLRANPHYAGVRATAAFPLQVEGVVVGTLSVHAAQSGYFDDKLTGLLAEMARNLSFGLARIEAVAARRTVEDHYRQLFDHVPIGIVVHVDSRILLTNPAMQKVVGAADSATLAGRSLLEFFRPGERDLAQRNVSDSLLNRTRGSRVRALLQRLDGTPFHAEAS